MLTCSTKNVVKSTQDGTKIPKGTKGTVLAISRKENDGFYYLVRFESGIEMYCPLESLKL